MIIDSLGAWVLDEEKAVIFDRLVEVIALELEAQIGVGRQMAEIPELIADTVMDFFELQPKAPRESGA